MAILSDIINKNGLIQNVEAYTQLGYGTITGNTALFAQILDIINQRYARVWHLIYTSSDNWKHDDGNFIDLPQSITDLEVGKSLYTLPTDALVIERVEIQDKNGVWIRLQDIAESDIKTSLEELRKQTGTPKYYRLIDNVTEIFPKPDYTKVTGIKWEFDRANYTFLITDSLKSPGFASPYHKYLAIGASLDYMFIHVVNLESIKWLKAEELILEKQIKEHYSTRFEDNAPIYFRIPKINYR
jgi:hypothetical protein